MRVPSQLPLALTHPPYYGRDSFMVGPSNRAALQLVERWPDWPAPVVVLTGPAGSGKTHLAHIWADLARAAIVAAAHLDSAEPLQLAPGGGLVVEDVAPGQILEAALFHLINRAREGGASLLVTSRTPVADWQVGLPDLRSRLRMAAPVAVTSPDDELLRKVLVKLFTDRQLAVDKAVVDYLLVRMERSLAAATAIVEMLDREALAAGGGITRPLAARILSQEAREPGEFTEPK